MTWPLCTECEVPVELDDVEVVRRRRVEQRALNEGTEGYRVPEDVHLGTCLVRRELRVSREAVARSTVPNPYD